MQQPQQDADGISVSRWRSARGLSNRPSTAPGTKHACHDRPSFARVGHKTFLCEACGWAHVCDASCTERVVQRGSGMPVCPISGRCFERMMSEWEVSRIPAQSSIQSTHLLASLPGVRQKSL